MREVWGVLSGGPPKPSWRCVYKGLALLEHLIKNGSEMCVDEARDKLFRLKSLCDYAAYEGSADKGAGIRSKAAALVEMLQDNARVRSEREAARTLRAKLVGINQKGGLPSEDRFGGGGGGGSYGAYSRCALRRGGVRARSLEHRRQCDPRALFLSLCAAQSQQQRRRRRRRRVVVAWRRRRDGRARRAGRRAVV